MAPHSVPLPDDRLVFLVQCANQFAIQLEFLAGDSVSPGPSINGQKGDATWTVKPGILTVIKQRFPGREKALVERIEFGRRKVGALDQISGIRLLGSKLEEPFVGLLPRQPITEAGSEFFSATSTNLAFVWPARIRVHSTISRNGRQF